MSRIPRRSSLTSPVFAWRTVSPAKRSPGRTVVLSAAGWQFLETLRAGRAEGDWLVRRTDGSKQTRSTMWGHLYAAAQRDDRTRGINFHMLRHTYANRIRDAGISTMTAAITA
ncbi:MAG: tyrosine-type recombinase/integrase [Rhodospirillaceae bacterium]|nr:tyrosine-type recombinase/integrase [Rhodospirillaceae bacterium]